MMSPQAILCQYPEPQHDTDHRPAWPEYKQTPIGRPNKNKQKQPFLIQPKDRYIHKIDWEKLNK